MRRSGCRTSGTHDHVQTPLNATMDHHSRAKRLATSLPKDQVLVTLKEIDDTERIMWTERVSWPRAGMVIQHTMRERVHVGLGKEGGWNKPELEPRVAIIAKRSGYRTMFAYVPSPTQVLIQLPESESSNGESSLLARGMDYDKIGYIHSGKGWVRQTCREHQEKRADWCRIVELSDFMAPHPEGWDPTQGSERSSREQECIQAGAGWVLHRRPAGITA